MTDYDLDLLVIGGGGSGGFTAATTAMKSGARVGMVEMGRLGGLCILAGCMPTKSLLHSAADLKARGESGRQAYPQVAARMRATVEYLAGHREDAVAAKLAQGLILHQGRARFRDSHTVEVDDKPISAAAVVVATGSTERIPELPGLEQVGFLTSDDWLQLETLPSSLIVLGGGNVALELAQYAARMGVKTTILQRSGHLLSKEAPQVGGLLAEVLGAEGVEIFTDTELIEAALDPAGKAVRFKHQGGEQSVAAQEILVALGRRAQVDDLGLEAAGVELARGAIKVDRQMRTSAPHIFAAGDVTGVNMVVNLAIVQGEVAGYNATHDQPREIDDAVLPRAVFTDPQFARVGLNGAECQRAGLEFVETSMELGGIGVARTYPQPLKGFMAMRAGKEDGKILGAEIVAPHASLMIHEVAVAMKLGGAPADIADIPYAHPCLSELVNFTAYRLAGKMRKAKG